MVWEFQRKSQRDDRCYEVSSPAGAPRLSIVQHQNLRIGLVLERSLELVERFNDRPYLAAAIKRKRRRMLPIETNEIGELSG